MTCVMLIGASVDDDAVLDRAVRMARALLGPSRATHVDDATVVSPDRESAPGETVRLLRLATEPGEADAAVRLLESVLRNTLDAAGVRGGVRVLVQHVEKETASCE